MCIMYTSSGKIYKGQDMPCDNIVLRLKTKINLRYIPI